MKKILIVFAAVIFGFSSIHSVNAQTDSKRMDDLNRAGNKIEKIENREAKSTDIQTKRLEAIKKAAARLIENRLNDLNMLRERIQSDSKLPQSDKDSFVSQIQKNIDGLNALKTKIEADTDIETAKADAKSIITDYYIYRFFIPKIRLSIAVANLQSSASKFSSVSGELQKLVDKLASEGKDTAEFQELLSDANSNLLSASVTLQTDKTKLESLSASSDFQSAFTQVRRDLAGIKTNFAKIKSDVAQMRKEMKEIMKSTPNSPAQ